MRALVVGAVLLVVLGVGLALWTTVATVLDLFMAVVAAVALRGLAEAIQERVPFLGTRVALVLVTLVVLAVPVGLGWVFAPQLERQVSEASSALPELQHRLDTWITHVEERLHVSPAANEPEPRPAQGTLPAPPAAASPTSQMMRQQLGPSAGIARWAGSFVGSVSQAVVGIALFVLVTVYLALSPGPYLEGFVALFPASRRPRARAVLHELATALRWWVVGQVVTMATVGTATGLGLWIVGMPMPLLLGVLAGLLDLVPNFGPILAFAPALLLAAGNGKALAVCAVYAAVQMLEGWLLRPFVERRAASTLPGLLLGTQVVLSTIAGFMGLVAAPALLVVGRVVLQRLYLDEPPRA